MDKVNQHAAGDRQQDADCDRYLRHKNVVALSTDCPQYEQAVDKRGNECAQGRPDYPCLHKLRSSRGPKCEEASWSATIVIEGCSGNGNH